MAEVATMILSPFLEAFFGKLASGEFKDFFQRRKLSDELVENLKTAFLTVSAVIEDAEELVVTKPAVKGWLDKLKDAVYDAEHIMDEIATEALQSKLDAESRSKTSKLLTRISAFGNSFVKEIEPKIEGVLKRVNTLIGRISAIGLKESVGVRPSDRIETSHVYEPDIFGRNNDKDEMIKMLLSDDSCDNELGVVAIVGMGGLGKTTLAQLVFNDDRVKNHFNCHAWVCVSDQFDLMTITKTILDKVASSDSDDKKDLDKLQSTIKQNLMGKKFLLVLDDVWNQNYVDWEKLSKPFRSMEKGSRIIVTTRIHDVALTMRAKPIYPLNKLGEEDCWSLFTKHAFHSDYCNANPHLKELGKQIVEKCDGLPLAIKTIGALLGNKLDVGEWEKILKSEIWDLPLDETRIIPALKLSYKYLPSYVKRCFAYCSIFPKDYAFKKESLILLWMGESFLHESRGKTIEEVGDDYFSTLVSRSLFQQSIDNKSSFIMHDLVNDLATFVSGQFIVRLDDNYSYDKLNNVRHLSYGMENFEGFKKFEFLCRAKKLCTFLPLDKSNLYWCSLTKRILLELLPMLKCLHVLSLSHYENIIELPDSIGKLKHLRYLDLSNIGLQKLPDSIYELYNLQVLNLSYCRNLVALPKEMWKLINLRHLGIINTSIKDMPMQLGKLKCLKTLTQFVTGEGYGCCIAELGNLPNLQGSLDIVGLRNVKSPTAALDARMRDKKCLNELKLEWEFNGDADGFESQRDKKGLDKLKLKQNFHGDIDNSGDQMVLDNLQPNTNLKGFHICSYRGKHLSNWLGNPSSKLVSVKLENCKNCESLPPLGHLPFLEVLSIIGLDGVVSIGREFYCTDSSSVTPFKGLKNLSLTQMEKWEEWVLFEAENGVAAFPQLENLCIRNCPKLIGGLPGHLPSLVELEIDGCPQLVASLPRAMILHKLVLSKCKVLLEDLPTGLKILTTDGLDAQKFNGLPSTIEILNVKDCEKLEFLPQEMTKSSNSLQELSISQCSSSMSLRKDGLPSALKELTIERCNNLEFLSEGMINSHNCLQELSISACSALKLLPKAGFPSTLKTIRIDGCSKLKTLPEEMKDNCLQQLFIYRCAAFESFPKGGLLSTLKTVGIASCENLEFSRNLEFPSLEDLCLSYCNLLKTFPLDLFPKLYKLSIWSCSKLESLEVSENYDRDFVITNMIILDCPNFVSLPKGGLRAPRLASFRLENCGNMRSAPNIFPIPSDRGLTSNLESIYLMYSLVVRWMEWGWGNFPSLRGMFITGDFEDFESFPEVLLLPSSLTTLGITSFSNLKSLDKVGLQHLNALECLCIGDCPKLKYMPEQGLTVSVSLLQTWNCPLLEKQWKSKKGKEWRKIAHVEQKLIQGEFIE